MACEFPQWCGRLDCELLYPYTLLLLLLLPLIFTARHYASAVCAVIVCPSAYPSVHRKPVSHRNDESNWFLAWELPSTDPTLCCKKILVPLKIRVLLSGTLSQTLDSENFATTSRSRCQQKLSTVELVDNIYNGRCVVAVYYTSASCKPISPSLRFVLDLLSNMFLSVFSV